MFGSQDSKKEKYLKKYHLEDLDEDDLKVLDEISGEFLGLSKAAGMLTMNSTEQAKVQHLSVLVKQNWMIIKKLNEISNKLDK
ncbi:hypothetical protein EQV77_14935 [Halobacillus fulvus]|nr:hypothetical protein EQV77_14935 [Halobacillus fulvus]